MNENETKVEVESNVFTYLKCMLASFHEVEKALFPIAFPKIEERTCSYCGHSYIWSSLWDEVSKHWEKINEAGGLGGRQIDQILAAECSSALKEKKIVTCAAVRDRVVQSVDQISNCALAAGYKQFLQRDPAEVIAS